MGCWLFHYRNKVGLTSQEGLEARVDCLRRLFLAGIPSPGNSFKTVFDFGERDFDTIFEMGDSNAVIALLMSQIMYDETGLIRAGFTHYRWPVVGDVEIENSSFKQVSSGVMSDLIASTPEVSPGLDSNLGSKNPIQLALHQSVAEINKQWASEIGSDRYLLGDVDDLIEQLRLFKDASRASLPLINGGFGGVPKSELIDGLEAEGISVYESSDSPGVFGFTGCDCDQWVTHDDALHAALVERPHIVDEFNDRASKCDTPKS